MKNQIEVDAIWELHLEGNEQTKASLKKMYLNLFLKKNHWYVNCNNVVVFYDGSDYVSKTIRTYGFDNFGNWNENLVITKGQVYRELSGQEICHIFVEYLKRKNKDVVNICHTFDSKNNRFYSAYGVYFENEKWLKSERRKNTWYKDTNSKALVFFTSNHSGYGFNNNGNWFDYANAAKLVSLDNKCWSLASTLEVKQALINEAKKRGFKKGVYFKDFPVMSTIEVAEKDVDMKSFWNKESNDSTTFYMSICNSCGVIYRDGKWSEIVEPKNKPMNWYKTERGHLKFFLTEEIAFGFNESGKWANKHEGLRLNGENVKWELASDKEVKHRLMQHALNTFEVGEKVYSALTCTVQETTIALLEFSRISTQKFDIKNEDGVFIFDADKGNWARKLKFSERMGLKALKDDLFGRNSIYFADLVRENKIILPKQSDLEKELHNYFFKSPEPVELSLEDKIRKMVNHHEFKIQQALKVGKNQYIIDFNDPR